MIVIGLKKVGKESREVSERSVEVYSQYRDIPNRSWRSSHGPERSSDGSKRSLEVCGRSFSEVTGGS